MLDIGDELAAYIHLKYSGPLPPYSFSSLEFDNNNYLAIDRARSVLQLPEQACLREIKTAFRRLSMQCHPDRSYLKTADKERYQDIVNGYDTLKRYCESQETLSEDFAYAFDEQTVNEIFLIKPYLG